MAASHRGVITGHGSPIYSTRTLRRGRPNLPDDIPLPQSPGVAPDTLGYQVTSPSPPRSTNERERARRGPETDGPSSLPPLEPHTRVSYTRKSHPYTRACHPHFPVGSDAGRTPPGAPIVLRHAILFLLIFVGTRMRLSSLQSPPSRETPFPAEAAFPGEDGEAGTLGSSLHRRWLWFSNPLNREIRETVAKD